MAKYKYDWTEEKIKRFYKEGRGSGESKNYKPWLTVQDCPSNYRVTRCLSWKTGREHHLFNDQQTRFLFVLDWADDVRDIREHYPLDREITQEIAQKRGIKHPIQSDTPLVITTDFLITVSRGNQTVCLARSVMPKREMERQKVKTRMDIEQEYWSIKQINWAVVTEDELPKAFISNLEWVHEYYQLEEFTDLKKEDLDELILILLERIKTSEQNLQQITSALDRELNIEAGTFLYLVRHLIARKIITLDMNQKIYPQRVLAKDIAVNPYHSAQKEQLYNVCS